MMFEELLKHTKNYGRVHTFLDEQLYPVSGSGAKPLRLADIYRENKMYEVKISYSEGVYTFKMERAGRSTEFTMSAKQFEANGFVLSGLLKEHAEKLNAQFASASKPEVKTEVKTEVKAEAKPA